MKKCVLTICRIRHLLCVFRGFIFVMCFWRVHFWSQLQMTTWKSSFQCLFFQNPKKHRKTSETDIICDLRQMQYYTSCHRGIRLLKWSLKQRLGLQVEAEQQNTCLLGVSYRQGAKKSVRILASLSNPSSSLGSISFIMNGKMCAKLFDIGKQFRVGSLSVCWGGSAIKIPINTLETSHQHVVDHKIYCISPGWLADTH